jgi:arsenate reductase
MPTAQAGGGTQLFHHLPKPLAPPGRKRVLFVCIGNSCRSQMAEGFARTYAKDAIEVCSAGLSPAPIVQGETHRIMGEFGVTLTGQHPKGIELLARERFDVVVNISGEILPRMDAARILEWKVRDPIGLSEEIYRDVAKELERLVMALVNELR